MAAIKTYTKDHKMTDTQFKLDIVQILKKLTEKCAALESGVVKDPYFNDEDFTMESILASGLNAERDSISMTLPHSGTGSVPIDLEPIFEPSTNYEFNFTNDDTSFTYVIFGQNAINASITNGHYLTVPSVDSSIERYALTVRISTEHLGITEHVDCAVSISFNDNM